MGFLSLWGRYRFLCSLLHISFDLLLSCCGFLLCLSLGHCRPRYFLPRKQILFPLFFHPLLILKLPYPGLQLVDIEQFLTDLLIVVPPDELNVLLPLILDDIPLIHRHELLLPFVPLLAEEQLLDAIGDLMLLDEGFLGEV